MDRALYIREKSNPEQSIGLSPDVPPVIEFPIIKLPLLVVLNHNYLTLLSSNFHQNLTLNQVRKGQNILNINRKHKVNHAGVRASRSHVEVNYCSCATLVYPVWGP